DAFLTLAYTDEDRQTGLTCFLVPRWRPDGTRNQVHIMRLKDKLGDRANASSEIEYHGAVAWPLGEIGRGIPTIIEMVQHTRLDCTNGAGLLMRQAVAQALWHVSHRSAFQRKLIDQPLMRQVLADLLLEVEAATALTFRIARSFDEKGTDETAGLFARIATPIGKYCVNKRVVPVVFEAMECLGGAGFVEESILPRIYRQSPLNSIWEGSGNVICLDVLRAMARSPDAVEVVLAEIAQAKGASAAFDRALDDLKERLRPEAITEQSARHLTEHFGLLLQASLLLRHTPAAIGETFAETRLGEGRGGASFGAFSKAVDADVIIERGSPLKAAA
ncbi:MAG: acyl-CoA dehydrogenase family protein, partial [Pseudomonadota bacterium]